MLNEGAKMKCARVFLYLLALPLLVACATPFFHEEPLGEIATLNPQEWNGLWLIGRNNDSPQFVSLNVVDDKKGIMQFRLLKMSEGCPPLLVENDRYLFQWRRIGRWYFATPDPVLSELGMPSEREMPSERGMPSSVTKYAPYGTAIAFFRSNAALIWYQVNPARAHALILRKQIPGRIVDKKVVIEKLSSKQHELLFPDEPREVDRDPETALPAPVYWERPNTLVKLPDQLVPCK